MGDNMAIVLTEIRNINKNITTIKEDVSGLKNDVSGLKEGVATLKGDVSSLKEDVSGLKKDVSSINTELSEVKRDAKNNHKQVITDIKAMRNELRIVKDQTAKNVETQTTMNATINEKVIDLQADVKLLKRVVLN